MYLLNSNQIRSGLLTGFYLFGQEVFLTNVHTISVDLLLEVRIHHSGSCYLSQDIFPPLRFFWIICLGKFEYPHSLGSTTCSTVQNRAIITRHLKSWEKTLIRYQNAPAVRAYVHGKCHVTYDKREQ